MCKWGIGVCMQGLPPRAICCSNTWRLPFEMSPLRGHVSSRLANHCANLAELIAADGYQLGPNCLLMSSTARSPKREELLLSWKWWRTVSSHWNVPLRLTLPSWASWRASSSSCRWSPANTVFMHWFRRWKSRPLIFYLVRGQRGARLTWM